MNKYCYKNIASWNKQAGLIKRFRVEQTREALKTGLHRKYIALTLCELLNISERTAYNYIKEAHETQAAKPC